MKNILVAGGAGFIGFHLCKKLLEKGERVLCVDNFTTGQPEHVKILKTYSNFSFLKLDINDLVDLEGPIDQIYNLASPASPEQYQNNSLFTLKTNISGTENLLKIARVKHSRILQASTSEIYGEPLKHPQKETDFGNVNSFGPRACYDEGKRTAETLFYEYWRLFDTDIRIARIFNTYGPGMEINDGRVVSNFVVSALKNKDIKIYGNGLKTRSFQYVSDLTNGLIALMESDYKKPVNLGNPEEYTVGELAELVLKLIPESKSQIVYLANLQDDPTKRKPDITLAKKVLRWEPAIPLENGLTKVIEYYRSLL